MTRSSTSRSRRAVDLLVAVPAAVFTAPIVAIAAAALRVGSTRPSVVRVERVGLRGQRFEMFLLRTACDGAGRTEPVAGPDEPDDTVVSRVVRAMSIDELPLLWNVVRGEMTLVGPAPSEPVHDDTSLGGDHGVRPGLVGLWQQPDARATEDR